MIRRPLPFRPVTRLSGPDALRFVPLRARTGPRPGRAVFRVQAQDVGAAVRDIETAQYSLMYSSRLSAVQLRLTQ